MKPFPLLDLGIIPAIYICRIRNIIFMTQKMQFKPASDYTFDGIKLGMNFKNDIMFKEPFNVFCDDDP